MSPRSPLWVRVFVGISVGFCAFSAGMLKVSAGEGADCGAKAVAYAAKGGPGTDKDADCQDYCQECCNGEFREICLKACFSVCTEAYHKVG